MTARVARTVVAVLCLILATPDAVAQASVPAQSAPQLIRLVQQTPFVEADGVFSLRLRVTGAPPDAQLRFAVHDRVRTRTEFTRTLEGRSLRAQLPPALDRQPLDAYPSDSAGTILIRVPVHSGSAFEENSVRLATQGVYPVVVQLLDAGGDRVDQLITHLIRVPPAGDDLPALAVGIVLPIAAPPALQVDGSLQLDEDARAGATATVAALQNHPEVALTIAPTPETLDALETGREPDDQDVVRSARSALTGREVLGQPYIRAQTSAWLDAGLRGQLGDALDRGDDVVGTALGRVNRQTWRAESDLDNESLEWLLDRGVDSFVVPEASLTALDLQAFPTTLARPFRLRAEDGPFAVAADAGLAAHVGASSDPALDAAHLVADLATIYFDQPGADRGVVLVVPPEWSPSAEFLEPLLTALSPSRLLEPVTVSELLREIPPATVRKNRRNVPLVRDLQPSPADNLTAYARGSARGRSSIGTYESAVGETNPRVEELRRRLLVGGAVGLSSRQRLAYVAGVEATAQTEFEKIEPPPRQTITLTGRTGRIPLLLRNRAGYPVTVTVQLQADKLEFPRYPDGRITVELTEETTRLELGVRARASGDSPLNLRVVTPDGRRELGATRFTVRSTAVSGVGIVLSVGAGLVLVAWWIRNARDSRRPRRSHQ